MSLSNDEVEDSTERILEEGRKAFQALNLGKKPFMKTSSKKCFVWYQTGKWQAERSPDSDDNKSKAFQALNLGKKPFMQTSNKKESDVACSIKLEKDKRKDPW